MQSFVAAGTPPSRVVGGRLRFASVQTNAAFLDRPLLEMVEVERRFSNENVPDQRKSTSDAMTQPTATYLQITPQSVVWVENGVDLYLSRHLPELTGAGLTIELARVESTPHVVADVRVMPEWAFDRLERLRVEYPLDPRPTLLLGSSADSIDALLRIARNSDEVGHGGEAPSTIVHRIARLAGRAESYRRAGEGIDRDALTGLWNRQRLFGEIERLLESSVAGDDSIALVMLDLDWFKQVNDTLGHRLGDMVLSGAAGAIRRTLRAPDFASRCGGEEFAVLLRRSSEAEILEQAELIRRQIGSIDIANAFPEARTTKISASAGMALYTPGLTRQEWLHRVDVALYEAKSKGRDQLISYAELDSPTEDAGNDLQVRHFQNVTRVVTERVASLISLMGQQVVRSIQKDANQDALTAVFNRRYFDKRIAREFGLASKDGRALSLAFLDIDNFGQFNRSYGAPTGDAVLRQFAGIVTNAIRPVDWLARYGGEEFCVVMPAPLDEALIVAERLRSSVAEGLLIAFDGTRVQITVSIGVAEHRTAAERPEELVLRASKALQEAKRLGRNQVCAAPQ